LRLSRAGKYDDPHLRSIMKLDNATVLVTGANRGIGLAFAKAALARGARKVYAGARDPGSVTLPGVTPIRLDVNSPADIAAAVELARDTTVVVNNAGIAQFTRLLEENAEDSLRQQLETNVFGVLRISRAFAPVLAANGGGALLNVASVASWISRPGLAAYAVSKSATWSLSNGLRHELRGQQTQVLTLHMAFVDTDLTRGIDSAKSTPEEIVARAFDALEAGADEVLADETTGQVKLGLSAQPGVYLQARD
jgi:NAD(P)-dependent dehydrogenase (short-subunit alcohol dehydrogenase family)